MRTPGGHLPHRVFTGLLSGRQLSAPTARRSVLSRPTRWRWAMFQPIFLSRCAPRRASGTAAHPKPLTGRQPRARPPPPVQARRKPRPIFRGPTPTMRGRRVPPPAGVRTVHRSSHEPSTLPRRGPRQSPKRSRLVTVPARGRGLPIAAPRRR